MTEIDCMTKRAVCTEREAHDEFLCNRSHAKARHVLMEANGGIDFSLPLFGARLDVFFFESSTSGRTVGICGLRRSFVPIAFFPFLPPRKNASLLLELPFMISRGVLFWLFSLPLRFYVSFHLDGAHSTSFSLLPLFLGPPCLWLVPRLPRAWVVDDHVVVDVHGWWVESHS